MTPFAPPEWLSVRDLATLLGVSVTKIRNDRFRGYLPPAQFIDGYGLRWPREAINRWLQTGSKE